MHHGPEFTVVLIAIVGLAVGAALKLLSSRLSFPYTISVLLFGLGLGFVLESAGAAHGHGVPHLLSQGATISPHLIIFVFLPALVFESAYAIEVHEFRKNIGAVVLLAGPALILSTVMVAALMVGLTGGSWQWGWSAALVFGALISATDPVAVVAILRELGVTKRLGILIEGESLLNDGTSIVVFTVLIGMLTGATAEFSAGDAVLSFAKVVTGGVLVGLVLGYFLSKWIERLFNDPMSEITLTLVLAYSAMAIAEGLLHVSGVMAVVVAGLYMSAQGKTRISPEVQHFLHRFWGMLGFIANTLIFLLVGLVISGEARRATAGEVVLILGAYVGVMAIRFVLTYGFQPLVHRTSEGVSAADSAIVSWGGLRGAVSLALGLVVSQNPEIDPELRRQILLVTAGVVFLTILVNGSTIGWLLARLGYDEAPLGEQLARLAGRAYVLDGVAASLDELSRSRDLRTVPWSEVQEALEGRRKSLDDEIQTVRKRMGEAPRAERVAAFWGRALAVERQAYWEAFAHGTLRAHAVKLLSHELESHLDRLARGELEPPKERAPVDLGRGVFGMVGGDGTGYERLALVYDLSRAESLAAEKVLAALGTMRDIDDDVHATMKATYQGYLRASKERLEDIRTNLPEISAVIEKRLAQRIELNLEREGFERLEHRGALDEGTVETELATVEEKMHRLARDRQEVTIPETADLVAFTPMFSQLDRAALDDLAEITEEMVLPPGEYLFRQGDKGDALYVIARGAVHVVVGEDTIVDVLGGGDILGEISLLTGAPRTASIRAATTVTLGKISRARFDELMSKYPGLSGDIWRAFARRTFDNELRGAPAYSHLDRRSRLAWFDDGHFERLESGASVIPASDYGHLFVASGRVRHGGAENGRGAFVHLTAGAAVEALEDSAVALVPRTPPAPASETAPVSELEKFAQMA